MKITLAMIFILSSSFEAMACGLQSSSSVQNLLKIAQQTASPATVYLPKALVNGGSNLTITNAKGEEIKIDESLVLIPGMSISSNSGQAKIFIPTTGQTVELKPQTTLKVVQYNKSADQKICHLSFEMQSGQAEFTSEHQEQEKNCKPAEVGAFEVATSLIEITPIGTKYNVDLNQAIAELNGEQLETEENVSVKKGAVQIRLVKIKKTKVVKKSKSKKEVVVSNDDSLEEKPIVVTAGRKAKVKKGKKDRMADIQIVYPEQ